MSKPVTSVADRLPKSALAGSGPEFLQATGSFAFAGAVYNVTFQDQRGLSPFLDHYLANGADHTVAVLYLGERGGKRGAPSASLRFHFNRLHQVAAAMVIAVDRDDRTYSWMTRGSAARSDITLAHDTWNPDETTFSPESFITIGQLREVVTQWVVGDELPPPAVGWANVPFLGWL